MTLLTLLTIRLQNTTLQHKIGHSYYYTQFNRHAHPFTYYLYQKTTEYVAQQVKMHKTANYHTLHIL